MSNIKLSILDQTVVRAGSNGQEALRETARLAVIAEGLGYDKFWLSEHHNIAEIAGPSPELLIAYLAGQTSRITFGSAGIMLPNHSTLKVAENFKILESLFPGRIQLGLGRATGTDHLTAIQLNPANQFSGGEFLSQFQELKAYLANDKAAGALHEKVRAFPETSSVPQLWTLTSSGGSGSLAAEFGTALSFAHFINPYGGPEVIKNYKAHFRPSEQLDAPLANVGIFGFTSEDDEVLERWQAEFDYLLVHIDSGRLFPVPPYEKIKTIIYSSEEKQRIAHNRGRMLSGKPDEMKAKLEALAESYGVNEVVISTIANREEDKITSVSLLAKAFNLDGQTKPPTETASI